MYSLLVENNPILMSSVLVIQKRELSLTADQNFIIKTFSENRKSLKKLLYIFSSSSSFPSQDQIFRKNTLSFLWLGEGNGRDVIHYFKIYGDF